MAAQPLKRARVEDDDIVGEVLLEAMNATLRFAGLLLEKDLPQQEAVNFYRLCHLQGPGRDLPGLGTNRHQRWEF